MYGDKVPRYIEDVVVSGARQGNRNDRAYWVATQCRDCRIDQGMAESLVLRFAGNCSPPLGQSEALNVCASAYRGAAREALVARTGAKSRQVVGGDEIIAWDGEIGGGGADRTGEGEPDYVVEVPLPGGDPVADLRGWLAALFEPDDKVNYVVSSFQDDDGKYKPRGLGVTRARKDIEQGLDRYATKGYQGEELLRMVLGDWVAEAGVWARINPMDGKGSNNTNVVKLNHVLIEGDEQGVEQQLAVVRSLNLPCSAIVHSGGKSVHAVVRVDAGSDRALYKERVEVLFRKLEAAGFKPDTKCRNESRLSRLPGPSRDGRPQYLVDGRCGADGWSEWLSEQEQSSFQTQTWGVDDLLTKPENDNLLGKRFLCRQGSWLVVAQSGVGKSVFAVQGAVSFAVGRDLFGLKGEKPLRNLIIQAENNRGDMFETFTGIAKGLALSKSETKLLKNNFVTEHSTRYTSEKFVRFLAHLCRVHRPDIIWIDPLLSYIGGEISRMQDTSRFLRNLLQPVIEDHNIGLVVVHHTGKPPKGDDAKYKGHDLAYLGIGSSDITNWARATSTLLRMDNHDNRFALEHAKRADRAGCERRVELQHATDGSICWQLAEGIAAPQGRHQKPAEKRRKSKYDDLGLEYMPPVSGAWLDEAKTSSRAAMWVANVLSEAGMDVSVKAAGVLLKNRRLVDFLEYDKVENVWRGRLYVPDFE